MSDKEKITDWIKNLKSQASTIPSLGINALAGFQLACDDVIAFINSTPEEDHFEDKSEMVSEDLEEEIKNYIQKEFPDGIGFPNIPKIARHFDEWQKQQMMKDAVDGEVVYQIGSSILAPTDIRYKVVSDRVYIPNVKLGDKVKIIIVKED